MSTGLVENKEQGARLKQAFRQRSQSDPKAWVLPASIAPPLEGRSRSQSVSDAPAISEKSKLQVLEQQLFHAINRLEDVEGMDKDELYKEALSKLPVSGYENALQGAKDKCRLMLKIKQLDTVKLDKVTISGAFDKLNNESYAAAVKWISEKIDAKKLEDGVVALEDVGGVDKQALEKEVRHRAGTEGVDRSLAWAKLVLETNKPDSQVQKDFTEVVFQDDGATFTTLLKELGDKAVAELHLSFGGRKGLPVVKSLLKDVCKNDIGGLNQLINALK